MAKLSYITKGNSSPQGKQRAYFSGHPDEIEQYLDLIANEIWVYADIAIYYGEPDLLSSLDEIQLFVLLITEKYLAAFKAENDPIYESSKCPALIAELEFAKGQNKHILPILLEGGLENKANKCLGNLQLLNRCDTSISSIPYLEKLQTYLQNVIFDDELLQKIRNSFDAYVFLSYRKKDREQAQALMKLIHNVEFCRDIAIWYDEFLVPGEEFNDAISKAIEKSDLFALAITPNLVENNDAGKKNYIEEFEYPDARKYNKKILPAEMKKTDFTELSVRFPELPDTIDVYDSEKLSKALQYNFKELALHPVNNDPQHTFFIGLAYLNGIDVESDFDRAFDLIHQAANAGLLAAMEKLVTLYGTWQERTSIANHKIIRVQPQVIEWTEKIVVAYKEQYDKTHSFEDGRAYVQKIIELARAYDQDAYIALSDGAIKEESLTACKEQYQKAIAFCETFGNNYEFNEIFWEHPACYIGLAELDNGHTPQESIDLYSKAILLYKEIYKKTKSPRAVENAIELYNQLGNIFKKLGNHKACRKSYTENLQLARHLCQLHPLEQYNKALAQTYNNLGQLDQLEAQYPSAIQNYTLALNIHKSLMNKRIPDKSYFWVMNSHLQLAYVFQILMDYEMQFTHLKEAEILCNQLQEHYKEFPPVDPLDTVITGIEYHQALATSYVTIAKYQDALACYQQILDAQDRLKYRHEEELLCEIGDVYARIGDMTKAEDYYFDAACTNAIPYLAITIAYEGGVKFNSLRLLTWASSTMDEYLQNPDVIPEISMEQYEKLNAIIKQKLQELQ